MDEAGQSPDQLSLRDAELLELTREAVDGFNVDGYDFAPVSRATQARVWRGTSTDPSRPPVALRLTPKPLELIRRIAALVNQVTVVECPRTLALGKVDTGERTRTAHLCTWIGDGTPRRPDMVLLGRHLGRLHQQLAATPVDLTDRRLHFEADSSPPPRRPFPEWYIARCLWQDRVLAWVSNHAEQVQAQPIHGDLHWDNVVAVAGGGFGFIDFDKMMHAAPAFDLAKLIATGMFRVRNGQARLAARSVTRLLAGYESIRPLSETELAVMEGLAVLLNEETARLGSVHDIDAYRIQAQAVAGWWITRHSREPTDPLGLRASRRADVRPATPFCQPSG